jgi:hypothetical protein
MSCFCRGIQIGNLCCCRDGSPPTAKVCTYGVLYTEYWTRPSPKSKPRIPSPVFILV